jgi:hypothetical protein
MALKFNGLVSSLARGFAPLAGTVSAMLRALHAPEFLRIAFPIAMLTRLAHAVLGA